MPRVVPSQIIEYIDLVFPQAKRQLEGTGKGFSLNRSNQFNCAGLVALIDQLPQELLVLSGQQYSALVSSTAAISFCLQKWQLMDHSLDIIPGFGSDNPVTLIRRELAKCPDEFPSTSISNIGFIKEIDLRDSLGVDIGATNQALSNGEWKSATVLAGSIIEALLLWAIQQNYSDRVTAAVDALKRKGVIKDEPHKDANEWNFFQLIEVANEIGIIKKDTAIQSRLAKDYRNLIHAGREKRLAQKCDRGTALSAVAAVELTIRDLAFKFSS